ncbi:MAG: TonB-dependent receptor [Hyphomicrobiaceae bacterium]|nr:TonB-dependent receptor [Hyphomicrobiaceae bacterium]
MRYWSHAVALAMGCSWAATVPGLAQQPATTGQPVVQLPEVSVEAPAKRNIPKAALAKPPTVQVPGIVVEGEKVLRTLPETTTSIGVVTGRQIKDQQIQDLQEAINSTPNAIANEGSRGNSGFVIRGLNSESLTQNQSASAAALVSVVIDGATQNPEATRRGARSLWDVEQVEILRGPQSTLQARNSLAGAVFIKTNDPTYKLEGALEGTLGSNGLWSRSFMINAPIVSNQLAVRVSGQIVDGERNISYADPANRPLDDDRLANIRGKVLIEPSSVPGLSVLLTASRTEDRPAVTTVSGPNFFDRHLAASSSSTDFRQTKANNYIADVSYQLATNYRLRSITAFADTATDIGSAVGSSFMRDEVRGGTDLTQDLRLEIDRKGNGLSGVLGLFYGRFGTDIDSHIAQDIGFVVPLQDLVATYKTTSAAAYGEMRFRFMDRYQFIAGGRVVHDVVESHSVGSALDLGTFTYAAIDSTTKAEFTRALPKVGMTYDLASNQTIGFTYSQGYRPGFTHIPIGGGGAVNEVKPEDLNAYEILYRSQWLGGRLYLGGNLFYYDYSNQQIATDDAAIVGNVIGASVIVNGQKSHAYGAEIEARWRPNDRWQLHGGVGLLKTRFDDFVAFGVSYSGKQFPEAPSISVTGGAQYKDPSGWFAGGNFRFVDGFYSNNDTANTPARFVSSLTLVDARVGYEWERTKTTLTFFAKNIFDKQYVTSISQYSTEATVGDGRLLGVTLSQRF